MEEQKWKKIEPNVWKPQKEDDSIIGVLISTEPKIGDKNSAKYHIENKEGTFLVWGSTVLDDRMKFVKVGQTLRITFKQKTKNKKNQDLNIYTVEVAA